MQTDRTHAFKSLKRIMIGTGLKTASNFIRASEAKGLKIDLWALDVLKREEFEVADVEKEIHLVQASIHQLGFTKRATLQEIRDRIVELGYEICPAEAAIELHLQYLPQRVDELWHTAMEPLTDSSVGSAVFSVERDDDLYTLHCDTGLPTSLWEINDRFVFVDPRN